jgi:hypothetical protein
MLKRLKIYMPVSELKSSQNDLQLDFVFAETILSWLLCGGMKT